MCASTASSGPAAASIAKRSATPPLQGRADDPGHHVLRLGLPNYAAGRELPRLERNGTAAAGGGRRRVGSALPLGQSVLRASAPPGGAPVQRTPPRGVACPSPLSRPQPGALSQQR